MDGEKQASSSSTRDRRNQQARTRRDICFQCRNRKVKCDGALGGCSNCLRLHFECSLSAETNQSHRAHELQRRRVRRACVACRDRKSKCTGDLPACRRCLQSGLPCTYPDVVEKASSASPSMPTPRSGDAPTPVERTQPGRHEDRPISRMPDTFNIDKAEAKQHIDAYFDFIYPIPCQGFLHRAYLLQTWSQGTLNPCLLLAICGVTSRYIHGANSSSRAAEWMQCAENQLLMRLGEPRVSDIEAWLLVVLNHCLAGQFQKMLISMSLVTRLAYILRLNFEERGLPFLMQERRRRLMWSIFVSDTLYSSGRVEFTACPAETIHVQLPCKERNFSMDISSITEPLHGSADAASGKLGLTAYCLRVLDMRDRCQRLTLALTNHRRALDDCLQDVARLQQELQDVYDSLPSEYQLTQKNLFLRAYTPARINFVMLHTWWHQTHCDLYRYTIPGFREGLPDADIAQLPHNYVVECRSKCLSHALSVSDLLSMVQDAGMDMITDPSLAMCAFHSARIISRLGQPPLGNMARSDMLQRLLACEKALEEQAKIYPRTRIMKSGIADLVRDAQRPGPGSIWTDEANPENEASTADRIKDREVYSRYSVAEEIRKMRFNEEEGSRWALAHEANPPARHHTRPAVASEAPGETLMPQPELVASAASYGPPGMPNQATMGTANVQYENEPGLLGEYDALVSMRFDPRYQAGQPDIFMDAFWPIPGDADWMLGTDF